MIYLPNPAVGARGLYAALVTGLGGIPRFHTAALIAQTIDQLAAEKHERGRAVIVAVDEAHLLSADQLEELRLLTLCRARGYAEATTAACGSRLPGRGEAFQAARHNRGPRLKARLAGGVGLPRGRRS